MTTPTTDAPPATHNEVLTRVAQGLGTTPTEVINILESIERGESRADFFGFTDEVLRSIEGIALAYYRGQRYRDAHVVFDMIAILTDGAWAPAWRGMGACAQSTEKWAEAAGYFRRALAQDANDVHSAVYLGECLCLGGQRQEGMDVLQAVLQQTHATESNKIKNAPHLLRAQAIVDSGGISQASTSSTPPPGAQQPPPQAAATDALVDAASNVAVEEILRGLTAQEKVSDPEIQALLDNPETRAQLEELAQAVRQGAMTIRRVADFSQEQIDAGYAIACQMLERGEPLKAIQMAGWMLYIDSHDTRFYRLAGLCMHHLKVYPLADYYYTLVGIWRPGGADAATLMYHGEAKLMLEERAQGLAMLQRGLAEAGADASLKEVVKRAKTLLKQIDNRNG